MKSIFFSLTFCLLWLTSCHAQKDVVKTSSPQQSVLPYHEIPAAPESHSAENVVARMVDGLGYRYYWATEGLTEKDLKYKASETSRTSEETLVHLYKLSKMILNTVLLKPNVRGGKDEILSFEEQRKRTLKNIKAASDALRSNPTKVEDMKIIFQRGEKTSDVPFWHLLNGPLADAIWHTGQIVGNRRASGNPLHPGVNVFMGKTKE